MTYREHTLLFSHLDPEIFLPSQVEQFVPELFVATLVQQEVLLLAADLVTNRALAEYLCEQKQAWELVEDLIHDSDAITLVIHPLSAYHLQCEFDPLSQPVQAWAWMVEHTRLLGDEEFQPTNVQKSFYRKIDAAFCNANGHIRQSTSIGVLGKGNSFASHLREMLTQGFERVTSLDEFRLLNPETAKQYVEFASDDRIWKKSLKKKKQLPQSLEDTAFFRSAAYRCLRLFPMSETECGAWKSLFQSVFYSDFCTRLGVTGRFGGRLHDLPLDFTIVQDATSQPILELRVVSAASLALPVTSGIGAAVRKTRESFNIIEESPMEYVWAAQFPEKRFAELWANLVSTFANFLGNQQSANSIRSDLGIYIAPDTSQPLGVSFRFDPARIANFTINLLRPAYRRCVLEHRIKKQLFGTASVRAVPFAQSKSTSTSSF